MPPYLVRSAGTELRVEHDQGLLTLPRAVREDPAAVVRDGAGPEGPLGDLLTRVRGRSTADFVLADFLDAVSTGPQPAAPSTAPAPEAALRPELGPRAEAAHLTLREPSPVVSHTSAPALDGWSEGPSATPRLSPDSPGRPPTASPADLAPKEPSRSRPLPEAPALAAFTGSSAERPPTGAAMPDLDEWVERLRRGEEEARLGGLGGGGPPLLRVRGGGPRYTTAIVVTLLALALVGSGWTWVRTGAATAYPSEAELIQRRKGGAATVDGGGPRAPVSREPPSERAVDNAIRQRIDPSTVPTESTAALEDALFRELSNLGVAPRLVRVQARQLVGGGPDRPGKPVVADLRVELAGIQGPTGQAAGLIYDRCAIVLLVAGKYAARNGLAWERVDAAFGAPSPYAQGFDGRQLPALWTGRLAIQSFFATPSD